ncbi:hypothetical protein BC830DRAFT_728719 [Chytriomyces sp. MP71]|nr:hypothetical protein BC830DRAFT_728719 [Chytriomyces sp. MP71]
MSGTKTRGSKRVSASAATTLGAGVGGGVGTASGTALVASTGTTSAPVAVAPRPIHNQITSSAAKSVPAFLNKLYNMVSDPSSDLIHWTDDGQAFVVEKHEEFAQRVLPRFFKHNNFSSFVRQLNMYGFHKVPHLQAGALLVEDEVAEYWEFANPHFQRNQPDLLSLVTRKKGTQDSKSAAAATAIEKSEDAPISNGSATGTNGSTALVDVNAIVNEISAIKRHQLTISTDLKTIQRENQALWNESMVLREQYRRQQDTIDKIVKFLATVFEARKSTGPASVASLGGGGLSVSGGVGHGASGGAAGGIGVAGGGGMAGLNGAHGMGAGLGSGVGGAANPDALLDGMMGALGGGPASGLVGNPGSSVMEIPTKKRKLLTSGVLNAGSLSSLDSFEEFLDLDSLAAAPSGVHPAGFSVSAPGNSLASNRMSSIPASTLPGFGEWHCILFIFTSLPPPSSSLALSLDTGDMLTCLQSFFPTSGQIYACVTHVDLRFRPLFLSAPKSSIAYTVIVIPQRV